MDLEEFIKIEKENTRANNRLRAYKNDIAKMRQEGLSYKSIQKYLNLNGVSISIAAIGKFVNTHITPKDPKPHKVGSVSKSVGVGSNTPPAGLPTSAEPKKSNYVPPSWAGDVNIDDII